MVDLDAEVRRIIESRKFPFTMAEAAWLSGLEPEVVAFEWKMGRIGPALDNRPPKRRHAVNHQDLYYLGGLGHLGPVRRPVWRAELRRGFPRAVIRGVEIFHFGPFPVVMASIRRKLRRRLRRLCAIRLYVRGEGASAALGDTGLSPYLIAKRLDAESADGLLRDYPQLTRRDLRRASRYVALHSGPRIVRDYRPPMVSIASAGPVSRVLRCGATDDMTFGAAPETSSPPPLSIQVWRDKFAGR